MKLKKLLTGLFFVGMVLSLSAREIDAMKSLARELLKDVLRSENKTVIVGGFENNVGRAETSQLEDALQIAMYDTGKVEILDVYNLEEDLEGVDYICTGTISNGRSAYNMTVKLLDAETKKMVGVALKEIPKSYIADRYEEEEDDDDDDEWAKWFWGAVILHEATRPHHIHVIPEPPRPPRPNRPKPMRPARPKKGVERAERIN
jgi:hypothetical protein